MTSVFERRPRAVITFGEAMVMFAPDRAGKLEEIHSFRRYVAGAEFNTAVGLSRLQVPCTFAGSVGDDPFGEAILRAGRAEGLNVELLQTTAGYSTGLLFKERAGLYTETSVYYYRSASSMSKGVWNIDSLKNTMSSEGWMHCTGITWGIGEHSADLAQELLEHAHRLGVTISFDVNIRLKLAPLQTWMGIVQRCLPLVDWLLVGHEEAKQLTGTDNPLEVDHWARQSGFHGKGIVIKRGGSGVTAVKQEQEVSSVDAWPVQRIVDSVGAGDGFNAGWIAGMVRGWDVKESLRLGALVGALAVTSDGDYDAYPTFSEATRYLGNQREVSR